MNIIKKVLRTIPKSFHSNDRLTASLIDALAKCGDIETAESFFNSTKDRTIYKVGAMMKGNLLMFSYLLKLFSHLGYVANNESTKAIGLFHKTKDPDSILYILLFNACAQLASAEGLNIIKKVLRTIPKSFHSNDRLTTSLIDALAKCGDIETAQSLFNSTKNKNVQMANAMMKGIVLIFVFRLQKFFHQGFITNNQAQEAISLFYKTKTPDDVAYVLLFNACAQLGSSEALNIIKKVSSDIPKSFRTNYRLNTSLIDGLMECGDIETAESFFNSTKDRTLGVVGAMMKGSIFLFVYPIKLFSVQGFITNNQPTKAIDLFYTTNNPNDIIYILLFNACTQLGSPEALKIIKKVSSDIPESFRSNDRLNTALIDGLMKCGDTETAQSLFNSTTNINIHTIGAMMKGNLLIFVYPIKLFSL